MDEVIIVCDDCQSETIIKFKYISDIISNDLECKKCKSKHTFIKDFKWEKINDEPIELGRGGCGTVWK